MPTAIDLRHRLPEVMDDLDLEAHRHHHALAGLSRLNLLSRSAATLWSEIAPLARSAGRPLRLLDLASGAGDIPLGLWRRARRQGLAIQIQGVDFNPRAVAFAQSRADRAGADIRYQRLDVLTSPLPQGFDILTCSLFLHHLEEAQAADLLREMSRASGGVVLVQDLVRGRRGLWLARLASRLFTASDVVHVDALRSVRAAFTLGEARRLADRAGLEGCRLHRRWPCRFLLVWRRS